MSRYSHTGTVDCQCTICRAERSMKNVNQILGDINGKIKKEVNKEVTWLEVVTNMVALLTIPFMFIWQGYVLATMWGWFLDFGFRLETYQAAGALLIIRFIRSGKSKPDDKISLASNVTQGFLWGLMCLVIGWVIINTPTGVTWFWATIDSLRGV